MPLSEFSLATTVSAAAAILTTARGATATATGRLSMVTAMGSSRGKEWGLRDDDGGWH